MTRKFILMVPVIFVLFACPAMGQTMFKDVYTGANGSNPSNMTRIGNVVIFSAECYDPSLGNLGRELWRSDGTSNGTYLLKDIYPGGGSDPDSLTAVGTQVVFVALSYDPMLGNIGREFWRTDGTSNGTYLLKDIYPPSGGGSDPSNLTVAGSVVFFSALSYDPMVGNIGRELWRSDGTSNGTYLLKDIYPSGGSSDPNLLTAVGTQVFFVALSYDPMGAGNIGREIWRSDGTSNGTYLLRDIYPSSGGGSDPGDLTAAGSVVFFSALSYDPMLGNIGREFWRSDGTSNGTYMLKDIYPGGTSSDPTNLTAAGSTMFFSALTYDATLGNIGREFWRSDGTSNGTYMLKDIYPGGNSSDPTNLTAAGSTMFFSALTYDVSLGYLGREFWRSDGTSNGTYLLKNIFYSSYDSTPRDLTAVGPLLFFVADTHDGTTDSGVELWRSDGTSNGTYMLKDIYFSSSDSSPSNLTAVGPLLFFVAYSHDGSTDWGRELGRSDGTSNGTYMLKDIYASSTGSDPANLTAVGAKLVFCANTYTGGAFYGREPWHSDGTSNGTYMLQDIYSGSTDSDPDGLTAAGGTVFFSANTYQGGSYGRELWAFRVGDAQIGLRGTNGVAITNNEAVSSAKGTVFSSFQLGVSFTNRFAITNSGTADLLISGVATTGAGAAQFRVVGLPATVAAGTESNFLVVHTPVISGLSTCRVSIASTATNISTFLFNLAAQGARISTNVGPYSGGNTVTITNNGLGNGLDITNVLVGGVAAGVQGQGTNWVRLTMPAHDAGLVSIVIQSSSAGITTLDGLYTYNPPGRIYDTGPGTNRWTAVNGLPVSRSEHGVCEMNGRLYCVAGNNNTNVFEFDGTNWTATRGLPVALNAVAAVGLSNRAYCIGGSGVSSVYVYTGNTWTVTTSLPAVRGYLAATTYKGAIYAIGGWSGSANTNVYRLGPTNWIEVAGLPAARYSLAAAEHGDYLYAIGGTSATNVYRYDGTSWTEVAGLPIANGALAAASFNGWLYAIGGDAGLSNVYRYTGSLWVKDTNMPRSLTALGAGVLSTSLYAVGGGATNVFRCNTTFGTGMSPANGSATGGYQVVINGADLCNGGDVTNVTLCGYAAQSIVSQSATQVVVVAGAAAAAGRGDVRVYSVSFGETVLSGGFTYEGAGFSLLGVDGGVVVNGDAASLARGTDLGTVALGAARTNRFAITNATAVKLVINGLTTNGTGAALFTALGVPTNISPYAVSNFGVVFTPSAIGLQTAAVSIANNSTNTPFVLNLRASACQMTPVSGPSVGGTVLLFTNSVIGSGSDITNVLVGGLSATIQAQGANWVRVLTPTGTVGLATVVIQSASLGATTYQQVYTYNQPGQIGGHQYDWSSWEEVVGLPAARIYSGVGVLNGKLYVVGGRSTWGTEVSSVYRYTGSGWVYDSDLPAARDLVPVTEYNGALYAVGGGPSVNANVYRFNGSSWTEVAPLPEALCEQALAVYNGELYSIAGNNGIGVNSVYRYNGSSWSAASSFPANRFGPAADTLNGYLYAGGGSAASEMYRFDGSGWTAVQSLPVGLYRYAMCRIGNYLYTAGGNDTSSNAFRFDGSTWTNIPNKPGRQVGVAGAVLEGSMYVAGGDATNVYRYPRITASAVGVSPTTGSVTGGTVVTITGFYLGAGDVTNVTLCGYPATILADTSPTQIIVRSGPGALGLGAVVVQSVSYGTTTSNNTFTYTGPGILVLGTNRAGVASGSAASLAAGTKFAPLRAGLSWTNTLSITNSGTQTLGISGVSTGGTDAAAFEISTVPSTVAAGGVAAFNVTYRPARRMQGSCVGYWNFDEGSGTAATDASARGNHGVVTNADWTAGRWGSGLLLDGTGYVRIASFAGLPVGTNARTVVAWIKPSSVPSPLPWRGILGYGVWDDGRFFAFEHVSSSRLYLMGKSADLAGSADKVPTGQWTHVAVTYSGSTVQLWVNGEPDTSAAMGLNTGSSSVQIGYTPANDGNHAGFKGVLDEVAMYDRALSQSEIRQLMSGPISESSAIGSHSAALVISNNSTPGAYTVNLAGSCYAISTNRGPYAGGNAVTITNGGFGTITNVRVGGVAATIQGSGTNWVRITMPPAVSAGLKDIVIQTDTESVTLAGAYTINAAGVIHASGVTPSSGSWTGGYSVVISGSNLCNGGDATNVTLCGVNVQSIQSQSSTQLVVVAAVGAPGTGDVRVFSTSFGETVKSNGFEYLRVTLTVTNAAAENKSYNGSADATVNFSGAGVEGVVGGDDVTLDSTGYSASFASANAGTWDVTVSGLALDGADAGYYTLTQPTLSARILARQIAIIPDSGQDKTYGEADPSPFTYTFAPALIGGDSITGALARVAGEDAGEYAFTLGSLGAGGNYALTLGLYPAVPSGTPVTNLTFRAGVGTGWSFYLGASAYGGGTAGEWTGYLTNRPAIGYFLHPWLQSMSSGGTSNLSERVGAYDAAWLMENFALGLGNDGIPPGWVTPVTDAQKRYGLALAIFEVGCSPEGEPRDLDDGTFRLWGIDDPLGPQLGQAYLDALTAATPDEAELEVRFDVVYGEQWVNGSGYANWVALIEPVVAKFTIEAKALTVTNAAAQNKSYNGSAAATVDFSGAGVEGVVGGDDVTLDSTGYSASFASANAGTWDVTVSGLALDGDDAGNYALTQPTLSAEILAAGQTITFPPIADQVVTGAVGLAATASSGLPVSFATNGGPAVIADGTNLSFTAAGTVSIKASQPGNANWLAAPDVTNTFRVWGLYTLSIVSSHGTAAPVPGVYTNLEGTVLTNIVTAPADAGGTQFVSLGWALAGNEPAAGGGAEVIMTVTNNAVLTWLWTTNYWLNTGAGEHGSVNVGDGWQAFGVTTSITATADQYYHLEVWTGDAGGSANPLDLLIDAPKSVAATFAANMTTSSPVGVPQWWLAQYGLTNFEDDANADSDDDRQLTWEEYYAAETDPTNPLSYFHTEVGAGSLLISWPSASGRVYNIEAVRDAPGNDWTTTEWIDQAATPPMNTVTNPTEKITNAVEFFRTKARME